MIATHGCARRTRRPLLGAAIAVAGLMTTVHAARADMMSSPPMHPPAMSMTMPPGMGSQDPWQAIQMLEKEIRQLAPNGWNPGTGAGAASTMMPGAGTMPSVADWSKDHPCGCTPPPPPPTCSGTNMTGTPGADSAHGTGTGTPSPAAASTVGQPTPAPEPSTIVSALAMLGLVAWARRVRV